MPAADDDELRRCARASVVTFEPPIDSELLPCAAPHERAVLAYTDCLVLEGGRVPDAVFDALSADLSDEEILELTYIACTYDMHATISRALRLEFDDVDDPITEVPAPDGAAIDAMAVVDDLDE